MDAYFIEISGIPKDKVHPSFRHMEEYEEPETYSLFLQRFELFLVTNCQMRNYEG